MRARARVRAECDDRGRTRLVELRSSAPLLLRPTPGGVHLVGGAAGPVGGDDLLLQVDVGSGAELVLRSAAATLVHPGDGPSTLRVEASVGAGARLLWRPQPTIALAGCDHHADTVVELAVDASLWWEEDLVLGRHGEGPGRVRTRTDVERGGRPLLRHGLEVGPGCPGWDGPGGLAGARRVGTTLVVGAPACAPPPGEPLELAGDARLWVEVRHRPARQVDDRTR